MLGRSMKIFLRQHKLLEGKEDLLQDKIKATGWALRDLNKNTFGSIQKNKRSAKARLKGIQRQMDFGCSNNMIKLE